jgi:hypothetical protein
VGVVNLTLPTALLTGKDALYPPNKRLNGIHSWFGRFGEEKILLPFPGIKFRIVHPFQENIPCWKI